MNPEPRKEIRYTDFHLYSFDVNIQLLNPSKRKAIFLPHTKLIVNLVCEELKQHRMAIMESCPIIRRK